MIDNREIADSMMNALGYVKATTPADELRAAAARLRDTAQKATPGPWTAEHRSWAGPNAVLSYALNGHAVAVCGEEFKGADHPASADAAWIALASPAVAEPLAALLDEIAGEAERHAAHGMGNTQDEIITGPILDIARALNGGAA